MAERAGGVAEPDRRDLFVEIGYMDTAATAYGGVAAAAHSHRPGPAALKLMGDDARYVERPGRTSPPFPGHGMQPGQKLREDWFPVIFQR